MFDNYSKPSGNYIQRLIQTYDSYILAHSMFICCIILIMRSKYFPQQHYPASFSNGDTMYILRRKIWTSVSYRNLKPVFRLPGPLTSLRIPPVDRRAVRSF